jgi:quercetin dioxygenase-like cupin family protein
VHIKEMEPTKEVRGEYKIWNCFPYENNCVAKIYRIDMEPGAEYTGSSQEKKTRAYISVLEGEVKIRCGEEAYLVGKEDVFCLEMDRQHSYRNDTEKRISLICFFPDCHKRY